jgi:predicted membrane protein
MRSICFGFLRACFSSRAFFAAAVMTVYLMSITFSLLLSTHRTMKVFGVLALLSFAAAYLFYATWFISVWCFFAALLSLVVYLHFVWPYAERNKPRNVPETAAFDR